MGMIIDSLSSEGLLEYGIERAVPTIRILANGTINLDSTASSMQIFNGNTSGQIVTLPNATTLPNGCKYQFQNNGTQVVTINRFGGANEMSLAPTSSGFFILLDNSTSAGTWASFQVINSAAASGLIYNTASASDQVQTTSSTYVDLANMSVTAAVSGLYLILFNAVTSNTNSGQGQFFIINVNGTDLANSERSHVTTSAGADATIMLQIVAEVLAGQVIKIRWRRTANTGRCTRRTITAIKIR